MKRRVGFFVFEFRNRRTFDSVRVKTALEPTFFWKRIVKTVWSFVYDRLFGTQLLRSFSFSVILVHNGFLMENWHALILLLHSSKALLFFASQQQKYWYIFSIHKWIIQMKALEKKDYFHGCPRRGDNLVISGNFKTF